MSRHYLTAAFLVMGLLVTTPALADPILYPTPIQVALDPDIVNLSEGEGVGPISCFVELPEGFNPIDIKQVSLIKVNGQALLLPVESLEFPFEPVNNDGDTLSEIKAKFKFSKFSQYLNPGAADNELTFQVKHKNSVFGTVTVFEGTSTLRAIMFHIEQNPVTVGGVMRLVVDFVAPEACYAEAKGKVGTSDGGGFWKVAYHVPAGLQHWTLDVPVPVSAAAGTELKARMRLKLSDAPGGTMLRETYTSWKVPVVAAP